MTTAGMQPERVPEWTLGDRLRKARELTGLGVRAFAEQIGVSHGTITNAEGGRHGVRRITLLAYSMRTGVPVEWLETGKAPAQPKLNEGKLPHLDSNQEPSGSRLHLARAA